MDLIYKDESTERLFGYRFFSAMNLALKNPGKILTLALLTQINTVLSSAVFKNPLELSGLNGKSGVRINGLAGKDYTGYSVSAAGDFNGDGCDDFVIGATQYQGGEGGSGKAYVIYGCNSAFQNGTFDLNSLDGVNGFVINGADQYDRLGRSTASAGDFNGDGCDDLLVGAPGASPNGNSEAGESYIIFGCSGVASSGVVNLDSLDPSDGFVLKGINSRDYSGVFVSGVGDINGDGFSDIGIGAFEADPNGLSNAGQTYVVFGGSQVGASGFLKLSELDGANGFMLNGATAGEYSGLNFANVGDVNADGYSDLIVGAYHADSNGIYRSGRADVIFGGANVGSSPVIEVSSLNGINGFSIYGGESEDYAGVSVNAAGDFNGDGFDDILLGATPSDPKESSGPGKVYIIYGGGDLGEGGRLELSALNETAGLVIHGIDDADACGFSVSFVGDFNGDGFPDVVIGADFASPNGYQSGETYVLFGGLAVGANGTFYLKHLDGTNGVILNGVPGRYYYSGMSVSGAGDVNGDGYFDVIIGAPGADIVQDDSGAAYVIFGGLATSAPTQFPTSAPTESFEPSTYPSFAPAPFPTKLPVPSPSPSPTGLPFPLPSSVPVPSPSKRPVPHPSHFPTHVPYPAPSGFPTVVPSRSPTGSPSHRPTVSPSVTESPSSMPSPLPTNSERPNSGSENLFLSLLLLAYIVPMVVNLVLIAVRLFIDGKTRDWFDQKIMEIKKKEQPSLEKTPLLEEALESLIASFELIYDEAFASFLVEKKEEGNFPESPNFSLWNQKINREDKDAIVKVLKDFFVWAIQDSDCNTVITNVCDRQNSALEKTYEGLKNFTYLLHFKALPSGASNLPGRRNVRRDSPESLKKIRKDLNYLLEHGAGSQEQVAHLTCAHTALLALPKENSFAKDFKYLLFGTVADELLSTNCFSLTALLLFANIPVAPLVMTYRQVKKYAGTYQRYSFVGEWSKTMEKLAGTQRTNSSPGSVAQVFSPLELGGTAVL